MKFSPYYKYNFVSPEPIVALIREELKSYLDAGSVDDSIWSIYVDKCLRKLGRGVMQIQPYILDISNFKSRLPDNFMYVREAWLCTNVSSSYQAPGAVYEQVDTISTNLSLDDTYSSCGPCDTCLTPDVIKAVYKTTSNPVRYFQQQYLLKPGSIHTLESCYNGSPNKSSTSPDTFDIHNNQLITNFQTGTVYLLFYNKQYDESTGYQLIPDNYRIQEYIEAFIKQKVFEQLSNQVVDESYNQIQSKTQYYKQLSDEAYILADVEMKKETIFDKHRKNLKTKNNLSQYNINW